MEIHEHIPIKIKRLLHCNQVAGFKQWLIDNEWKIVTEDGPVVVLSATKKREEFIYIHRITDEEHYHSLNKTGYQVARQYFKHRATALTGT